MKIVVINGSPRKKWNTTKLLNQFVEGMRLNRNIEVREVNVYDYCFKGCQSCFACKLKRFEDKPLECRIKDDIHDLLVETRNADAVVIGSPIYFLDISAQLKAFLERLMYPGKSPKIIPATFIYTMNADEKGFLDVIKPSIDITARYWENNFGYFPKQIAVHDTYQRDYEELYKKSSHNVEVKKQRHINQFPKELENAYQEGIKFIKEVGA